MAVNAAGNYTKPKMRATLFLRIKAQAIQGTAAGQWSARKHSCLPNNIKLRVVGTSEEAAKVITELGKAEVANQVWEEV